MPGFIPSDRAKYSILDLLGYMRFCNFYSKDLEDKLLEFLFNLLKKEKDEQ